MDNDNKLRTVCICECVCVFDRVRKRLCESYLRMHRVRGVLYTLMSCCGTDLEYIHTHTHTHTHTHACANVRLFFGVDTYTDKHKAAHTTKALFTLAL